MPEPREIRIFAWWEMDVSECYVNTTGIGAAEVVVLTKAVAQALGVPVTEGEAPVVVAGKAEA